MREQIKNEMSKAIGSYLNSLTDSIAERCTEIALKYIEQSRQAAVSGSLLTCVDCGKSDDTVKDRGAFKGIQCYECKKNQDIEDDECR